MTRTEQARTAVGAVSVAFGLAATLAPGPTAIAFGVRTRDPEQLALLTRFVGIRNATMGASLLAADSTTAQRRGLQLGLAVGVSDVAAVLLAARRGALAPRAVAIALGALLGIAALGGVALSE